MLKRKLLASALTLAILGSALSAAGCGNNGRSSGGQDVSEEAWVTNADKAKDKNAESDGGTADTPGNETAGSGAAGGAAAGDTAGSGTADGGAHGGGANSGNLANGGNSGLMNLDFKPGFTVTADAYTPLSITPNAPQYTLNADLSNIENLDQFANLTQAQRDLIAKNGFVVSPTDSEQLFYVYEDNTYKKIPGFVTTDSVLQLYHIFYDYSLRNLETEFLYDDLIRLNSSMIGQLSADYQVVQNEEVKDAVLKMLGYFSVANLALGKELPADLPPETANLARQEYRLIENAAGKAVSPLFGYELDYSLFTVRGHYTRSEELGKFFRAMSWYGLVPMPFYDGLNARDEESAVRAIVTAISLCRAPAQDGVSLWENIYSTTSFFVGESDDITPYEVALAVKKVYSDTPDLNEIPDKLDDFYREVDQMRAPDIVLKVPEAETKLQMRFMGQRYIPDSEILQKLSEPYDRPVPTGLDVFAVFGSERADEILDEFYQPRQQWSGYQNNFDQLRIKFDSQTIPQQTNNLYNGWLYCLKSLVNRVDGAYPTFMKNTAWEDKSLSTALGSWAEIRHDTILYGKQSAAECGGNEPPEVLGYVEPNPEFFNRLLWLTKVTRESLEQRGLLSDSLKYKMLDFEDTLDFLKKCAQKELNGEDLSPEEHSSLVTYGGTLEFMSSSIAEAGNWYLVESDTDKNMAVIADVHTSGGSYLEAGVGNAAEIYVAVPQNGKIYLTRGAVFDFFEFLSAERLTDETWQDMIRQNPPQRPTFVHSYMDETGGGEVPVPDEPYSTGC